MLAAVSRIKVLSVALVLAALVANGQVSAWAQEKQEKKAAGRAARKTEGGEARKPSGRLPMYYGDVVSEQQREQIYKIQAEYAPQILELRTKLAALTKEQNDKVETLLSAEQKQKIADRKAATKRKPAPAAEKEKPAGKT